MNDKENILKVLFSFEGRLARGEHFLYHLLLIILAFTILFIVNIISLSPEASMMSTLIIIFATIISSVALKIKRFHDLGKSGINFMWFFVPFANFFVSIYIFFFAGEKGKNKYGDDPLGREKISEEEKIETVRRKHEQVNFEKDILK